MSNQIEMEQINRVVSDNIGSNPNLYGKVEYLSDIVSIRRVEIRVFHEQVNKGNAEAVNKIIHDELLPVVSKIRNDLSTMRYNVSDESNFAIFNYDYIFIRFRCSLRPSPLTETTQVTAYPTQLAVAIDSMGNPKVEQPASQQPIHQSTITWLDKEKKYERG